MESKKIITDNEIEIRLQLGGWWKTSIDEGRLMLLELLSKAGAGFYNSHTEESYLAGFGVIKKDRTPNKKGRKFMCEMLYKHSNNRPDCLELMLKYRV